MGWGSSTRRGGGRKVRALPRKFVFLGFQREESGMSREFCRDVPDPWKCSKSLSQKVRAYFQGFSELISITVTVSLFFLQNAVAENNALGNFQEFSVITVT